jgi:phage/plasmid-like protein (TIGR03299 family)
MHDLSNESGRVEMFYAGEAPCHGLGTRLADPATSAEAMAAAGLGFTVRLDEMYTGDGRVVPMSRAITREDTGVVLGTVGNWWKPIQNVEAFEFLDGLVADGSVRYHTAGALGRGERVWMLAKLPGEVRVGKTADVTEKYLLLSNTHGYGTLKAFWTPIRVVCQNTLAAASTSKAVRDGVRIRHTGEITEKLDEARHVLGLAEAYYAKLQERVDRFAAVKLASSGLADYVNTVFPEPEEGERTERKVEHVRKARESVTRLFETGRGADIPGVARSLWVAYNAVVEHVNHAELKPAKNKSLERARENRLASAWFGQGAELKARAFAAAVAFSSN